MRVFKIVILISLVVLVMGLIFGAFYVGCQRYHSIQAADEHFKKIREDNKKFIEEGDKYIEREERRLGF